MADNKSDIDLVVTQSKRIAHRLISQLGADESATFQQRITELAPYSQTTSLKHFDSSGLCETASFMTSMKTPCATETGSSEHVIELTKRSMRQGQKLKHENVKNQQDARRRLLRSSCSRPDLYAVLYCC